MSHFNDSRKRKGLTRLPLGMVAAFCFALSLSPLSVMAASKSKETDKTQNTLIQADQLSYDQNKDIVTATGHVEISQGAEVIRADKIVYNKKTDVVRAEGNVAVVQPSGDVIFADETELTSNMAEGFISKVKILFADESRMTAAMAQRYEGRYLIATRAMYTACNVCTENPDKPPLWQLRAKRVTDDNQKQDVTYRDAVLEFAGIPILYTPYFSHPEPSVLRRQGFLNPNGGNNKNLGTYGRLPYYFDIAPHSDMTITPTFSTVDGAQIATEWRYRFNKAFMKWNGSFTYADLVNDVGVDKGKQVRGHLFGESIYAIDNTWRAGSKIALTTDKSYLTRYSIAHDDVLVNRGYIERFLGRNYGSANLYYFQDLRPGQQQSEPIVAPEIMISRLGEPGKTLGGRWSFDSGFLTTTRKRDVPLAQQGPDTRRLSFSGGWERQFISSSGFLTTVSGLARLDNYWANNVVMTDATSTSTKNVLRTRTFAQGDITVRYPFGRRGNGYQQILEPIVQITAAPNMDNNLTLPNEDSLAVEFDETNLFAKNRFTGIDRLEGGTRTTYGVRHALVSDGSGRVDMLVGQTHRLEENELFSQESGLRGKSSYYVGRLDIVPGPWLDMNYGFMLNNADFSPERHAARASGGVPLFRPHISYISVEKTLVNGVLTPLEELTAGFTSTFAKYYTLGVSHTQAFKPERAARATSVTASYTDECFQFGITGQRDNTDRADIQSGTSVLFHFYLKNIGGVQTDSMTSQNYQSSK